MFFYIKKMKISLFLFVLVVLWGSIVSAHEGFLLHILKDDESLYMYVDNEIDSLGNKLHRCPAGSIVVSPDEVCINTLTLDILSNVDGIIQTLLTESFSTTDAVVEQATITMLSVTDVLIDDSFTMAALTSSGVVHNDASGLLSSSLLVNADVSASAAIADTKLATISTAGKVANSATTATSANTASAIVARDGSGNFATNMITLNGTTTNATDAATKTYVDNAVSAISGTSANTPNTLVLRDGSGNFSAGSISVTDTVVSGNVVLTANPSTSTTGNILKGSNSFIHNFGTSNTFVGESAGNFTMSGSGQNSAFGKNALTANTTGNNNTVVGFNALNACTTGSSNVAIGSGTGTTLTTGSNNIYISANAGTAAESTTTRIGVQGTQTACFIGGVRGVSLTLSGLAVVVDANGQFGTVLSTEKIKKNIRNMKNVSSNIFKLRPVVFTYKNDTTDTEQYGLIAEEVARVFPTIVVKDEHDQPLSVQYHVLPVLLLNEMQKQQVTIETMQDIISQLHNKLESFVARLELVENKI